MKRKKPQRLDFWQKTSCLILHASRGKRVQRGTLEKDLSVCTVARAGRRGAR